MVRIKTKRRQRELPPPRDAQIAIWTGLFGVERAEAMMGWIRVSIAIAMVLAAGVTADASEPNGSSGLPIPRFVSLKSDKVNVRAGPTKDHDVAWVYNRAALPVEVTAEFENWRRIRDWEGAEGWVYHSLLSGKRTALVAPQSKKKDELLELRYKPEVAGAVVAKLQHGVLATVKRCRDGWCRLVGEGFDGWIEEARLWGVYPGEKVE
jgi:SH3-like domain-containing protein